MLFSNKHRWVKKIHPDILPDFGKNGSKKIAQLLDNEADRAISYKFSPLDLNFFIWFTPLYEKQVDQKQNFIAHNVIAKTLHRDNKKYQYQCLTVLENNVPIGGVIFTIRKNRLSVAFRVFKPGWEKNQSLRCSPSLYAEYLLAKYALDNNVKRLVHGVDNNLYGVNASIGLAIFKLSVGCHPEISRGHTIGEMNLSECSADTLVLEYPIDTTIITNATLITTTKNLSKFEQLFKYEHLLKIKTILIE